MDALAKEVHKRAPKKFQRRIVRTYGTDHIWAIDLADMNETVGENDGYRYVLTVIDVFSRYGWAVPLKNKDGATLRKALEGLFKQGAPRMIWSDLGREFLNKGVQELLREHDVTMYHTYGEHKASLVERFNQTLKHLMWRKFTEHQTRRWLELMPELVAEYNAREHSTIGMAPKDAHTGRHEQELLERQAERMPEATKPRLKAGDRVRISRTKGMFEKGYHPNWSYEIFTVAEVRPTRPTTYRIKDFAGELVDGSFYEQELQKTAQKDTYLVQEVLKTRTTKGRKQHFVSWVGYPESANSWVDAKDLGDVRGMMKN